MAQPTHLVLIDAMSFFFRAYHAVRPLNRADGLPTNALFGFAQMLIKVVNDLNPTHCAVISDSPPPNWRHNLYADYKANRPPPEPAMVAQFPYLEPLVQAFGLPLVREAGLEADDLIASAVHAAASHHEAGARITIVTSDKDLLQLVGDTPLTVRLLDTLKEKFSGPNEAIEKFGVGPEGVLQVQALMGDSSDNIPGIAGVGPKTAGDLIQQFGTLENLYANLPEVKRDTLREKLGANREAAFLSRQLASLKTDAAVDPSAWAFTPTPQTAADYLEKELEFNSLAKRLRKSPTEKTFSTRPTPSTLPENQLKEDTSSVLTWGPYEKVLTPESWQKWLEKIKPEKIVAIDTETTSLNPRQAQLVGVCLAVGENDACYIPIKPEKPSVLPEADLFADPASATPSGPHGVEGLDIKADLRALLADASIIKIAHNLKYDWHILHGYLGDFELNAYEDTLLRAQCTLTSADTEGRGFGLDNLAKTLLGHSMITYESVAGKGKAAITFDKVPLETATAYAAEDADATLRLWKVLQAKNEGGVYAAIERPLLPVLVNMEATGICVDKQKLRTLSDTMATDLAALEASIHALTGHPFNVQSTQQLAVVLFDELGAGSEKQRKSRSTAVDVLEELGSGVAREIASHMLTYRQTQKLRSTYTEALLQQIEPTTGRVHTHYQQMGASTGRFSSSDPNLQNIPIRTEAGRQVRQAFIPQAGWQMVSADYSQIELRLLAHLSGSQALRQAFTEGLDIHAYTASLVAGVPLADVSKAQRRAAKFINFGLVYGMGARSLAGQIGCSLSEAQQWIDAYFNRYDGVRDYMEANKRMVREKGYVETLMGRRVWLPDIHSPNAGLRAGAERAAINAPLQGSNADIIKLAMVKVADSLKGKQANLLLQVHDELVLEAHPTEIENLKQTLPSLMGGVVTLSVPLLVEVGVGPNWDAAH